MLAGKTPPACRIPFEPGRRKQGRWEEGGESGKSVACKRKKVRPKTGNRNMESFTVKVIRLPPKAKAQTL